MSHEKPRVLIISEYIAPVQAVASIRWTKFAKYLAKEHGCEVTVLTNAKSYKRGVFQSKPYARDSALEKDMRWFTTVEIPYSLGQALSNAVFNLGRNVLDALKSRSAASAQPAALVSPTRREAASAEKSSKLDATLTNSLPEKVFELVDGWCGRAIARAGRRARIEWDSFDVMISTYGPLWPHLLAAHIKNAHDNLFWVADFRDPIVASGRTNTEENRRAADKVTDRADLVTAVSEGTFENLYLSDARATAVLLNGFDPEEVSGLERVDVDRFRFVYTGTLYSDDSRSQDLNPLFEALEIASSDGSVDLDNVCVDYAGTASYIFQQFAREHPAVPTVDHGLLPRDEALDLQGSASALVVASWNNSQQTGVLTGKVFEYLGRESPVIGLCSGNVPDSDLRLIIERCRVGMCYEEAEPDSFQRLVEYVVRLYRQWEESGMTRRDPDSVERVRKYSYSELTNKLIAIIEDIRDSA